MKNIQITLFCGFLAFFTACGLFGNQYAAAKDALDALKKVEAATQIGVDRFTYQQLLVDAKVKVNKANESLPKGELQKHLLLAMFSYEQAGFYWESIGSDSKMIKQAWQDAHKEIEEASKLVE